MTDAVAGVPAPPPPEDNQDVTRIGVAAAATAAVGVASVLMYTLASGGVAAGWTAFGGAVLVGGASSLSGGIIGFLFAIPRSRQERTAATVTATDGDVVRPLSDYAANTNLEQISDWLTKILVGIGLVQFKELQAWLGHVATVLSPMLGPATTARAATIAVMAYFGFWGFFVAYLMTRLWLPKALSRAEREEQVRKRQAENAAMKEEAARELREVERDTYDDLYQAPPGGFTRAIQHVQSYTGRSDAKPSAWLHVYLAAAHGQQHAWLTSQMQAQGADSPGLPSLKRDADAAKDKAIGAVKRALELDPSTGPVLTQLYRGTNADENDLVTLKPDLDEILGG